MHNSIGGYLIRDIQIVGAFDVDKRKVGKDISKAIFAKPNNATRFADVPKKGVRVQAGHLSDGIAEPLLGWFPLISTSRKALVRALRKCNAEIAINFLPTGSKRATEFYATACLQAGVAFINGIPEFISSNPKWAAKFERAGLPVAGDDIKSQFGATILNEMFLRLMRLRGVVATSSKQKNRGGNFDFKNLMSGGRLASKKISKTDVLVAEAGEAKVRAGPTGYCPYLCDTKIADICVRGTQFGGLPFCLKAKLEVEDSPNCAGVMVDAVRLMKLSLDQGLSGNQRWSAWLFKHPLKIVSITEARTSIENFVAGC
jgi:myo-inositol-1-phosphate synthase